MKRPQYSSLALILLAFPAVLKAGEPVNGPIIMLSSISGWLLAGAALAAIRQWYRRRSLAKITGA